MKAKPITITQAQAAMKTLRTATKDLEKINTKIVDNQVKLTSKHQPKIDELNLSIAENMELLEQYAEANKDTWKDKKFVLSAGTLQYKTNPPSVQLPENKTEDQIIAILKKGFMQFTAGKVTIDKKNIIAARDTPAAAKMMKATGIQVVQYDGLSIKPKL